VLSGANRAEGRLQEALTRAEQALAIDPSDWLSLLIVGETLRLMGRPGDAIPHLAKAYVSKQAPASQAQRISAQYAIALHQEQREAEALAIATKGESLSEDPDGVYYLACYWAVAGQRGKVFQHLQRALSLGYADTEITYDPAWDSLRGDPEFESIVAEIKRRVSQDNPG
jgi:tetratricopeptide (TPR) repeat protein